MKMLYDPKSARRLAKALSLLMFAIMSTVSAVVFVTQEQLSGLDYVFIAGAPFAMATLGYFVGRHHDPSASD